MFALSGIPRPSQVCLQLFGEKPFPAFEKVMVSLESNEMSKRRRTGRKA